MVLILRFVSMHFFHLNGMAECYIARMTTWNDPRTASFSQGNINHIPLADSIDEIRELITLCKHGCLYEVEQWVNDGRPLQLKVTNEHGRRHYHRSALEVAIETGQQSLVIALLANGIQPQLEMRCPFETALKHKQFHLIDSLFSWGVDATTVYPYEILNLPFGFCMDSHRSA